MANTKSAGKRARQTVVRTTRNRSVLTRLRKMQKNVAGGGAQQDEKSARALVSAVDKAAKRGIIHRNAANRRKARLNRARVAKPAPTAAPAAKASAAADAS
jgi:small subunit ribosomal protein S20